MKWLTSQGTTMEWLRGNLWEIRKSSTTRLFGAALALTHILSYILWESQGALPLQYYAEATPMCWSIWENCKTVRIFPIGVMSLLYNMYLGLGIVTAVVFFSTRLVGLAWFLLLILFAIKGIFYVQDLRLGSNTHYLLFLLNFFYLFIPNKIKSLKALIISFFLATGLLRLSPEWLSGQWILEDYQIHPKLAEWLSALTVLVQLVAPVGLLFSSFRYFTSSLCALLVYLITFWYFKGFFEPVCLITVTSLFVFSYIEGRRIEKEFIYQSFLRPEPSKVWVVFALLVFWGAQAAPYWQNSSPLTGQAGGLLALDHPAAATECQQTTFVEYKNILKEKTLTPLGKHASHLKCDPYLTFLNLKTHCDKLKKDQDFRTIHVYFRIRRLHDSTFNSVFAVNDFCDPNLDYSDLEYSSWNSKDNQ